LTAFINNLLTTARIEAAKVDPYPEPVDVFAHVKELVTLYQPQAVENGVRLGLVKKNQYISLVADVTMFRQIVLNLISNALKFTPHGEVEVILSEEDGDFILEVRDTVSELIPCIPSSFSKILPCPPTRWDSCPPGKRVGIDDRQGFDRSPWGKSGGGKRFGEGKQFQGDPSQATEAGLSADMKAGKRKIWKLLFPKTTIPFRDRLSGEET